MFEVIDISLEVFFVFPLLLIIYYNSSSDLHYTREKNTEGSAFGLNL